MNWWVGGYVIYLSSSFAVFSEKFFHQHFAFHATKEKGNKHHPQREAFVPVHKYTAQRGDSEEYTYR